MYLFGGSSGLSGDASPRGFTGELGPVGLVNKTIEDGIGVGRIPDQIESARYCQLAGDQR
jgi:hypothetical protein